MLIDPVFYDVLISFLYRCLVFHLYSIYFFFFKQKTAYEVRISDWSSDVCSFDLFLLGQPNGLFDPYQLTRQTAGDAVNLDDLFFRVDASGGATATTATRPRRCAATAHGRQRDRRRYSGPVCPRWT